DPGRGAGARLLAAPGRVVAVGEVAGRAVGVDVVAGGVNGARDGVEQRRGGFVPGRAAVGDVAGAHEHDPSRWGGRWGRRRGGRWGGVVARARSRVGEAGFR